MSTFTTPSRGSTAAVSRGGGGSSGRRVVRSALEVLMNTSSPELAERFRSTREDTPPQRPAAPSSFSVTYTNAPAHASSSAPVLSRGPVTVRSPLAAARPVPSTSATSVSRRAEPSTLDFLSPKSKLPMQQKEHRNQSREGHQGRSRSSSPAGTRDVHYRWSPTSGERSYTKSTGSGTDDYHEDAEEEEEAGDGEEAATPRRLRSLKVPPAPFPISPSRSLYSDVQAALQQQESGWEGTSLPQSPPARPPAPRVSKGHFSEAVADVLEGEVPLPLSEVKAMVTAALHRYERERDAEEEAVLQRVSQEVEEQAKQYAALTTSHEVACKENVSLKETLAETVKECERLEHALHTARQAQQTQKDALKRLEVELYHARDAQKEQRAESISAATAAAEWETQRVRYEKHHAVLEAQLSQIRAELEDKTASVSRLTARTAEQDLELASLRQRSSKVSAEAEEEYADIHHRMGVLARSMTSMEDALRERDSAIAEQAKKLNEAANWREASEKDWSAERVRMDEELARAREALERQTDAVRRRMERLTRLEQQKTALRMEIGEARQVLRTTCEEQGAVSTALEEIIVSLRRRLSAATARRTDFANTHHPCASRANGTSCSFEVWGSPHDTLVYDDDHSDVDSLSILDTCSSSTATFAEVLQMSSEDNEESRKRPLPSPARKSTARPTRSPTPQEEAKEAAPRRSSTARPALAQLRKDASLSAPRQRPHRAQTSPPSTLRHTAGHMTESMPRDASPTVKRLAQMLHHHNAQISHTMRKLQRCVAALFAGQRRSLSREDTARTGSRSGASADRLEQACRYLKSELAQREAALQEAQSECQWRNLSMKKCEEDLKTVRGDLLAAEKERLSWEAKSEMVLLERDALEKRLAEAEEACTVATKRKQDAEQALADMTTAHVKNAELAKEATIRKEAADAALSLEKATTEQQATQLREGEVARSTLAAELDNIKQKLSDALEQLGLFQAQEPVHLPFRGKHRMANSYAAGRIDEGSGSASEGSSDHTAEPQGRAEPALTDDVCRLETNTQAWRESAIHFERRCAALEEQLVQQADIEKVTLNTITDIVEASAPLMGNFFRAGSTSADTAVALTPHGKGASSTGKRLFNADDDDEDERAAEVAKLSPSASQVPCGGNDRSKRRRRFFHRRTLVSDSAPTSNTSARLPVAASPPPSSSLFPSERSRPDGAATTLALLRQHAVALVQRLAFATVRLRVGEASPRATSTVSPLLSQPYGAAHLSSVAAAPAVEWYGGGAPPEEGAHNREETALPVMNSQALETARNRSQEVAASSTAPREGRRHRHSDSLSPCAPPPSPPHGQQPRTPDVRLASVALSSHSRASAERAAGQYLNGGSPAATSQPQHIIATRATSSSNPSFGSTREEHLYNVSPWSRAPRQSSRSASPPVGFRATAGYAKPWRDTRSSLSSEGGLSYDVGHAGYGDVDGSCSPARPPSLRAASLPR